MFCSPLPWYRSYIAPLWYPVYLDMVQFRYHVSLDTVFLLFLDIKLVQFWYHVFLFMAQFWYHVRVSRHGTMCLDDLSTKG